MNIFEKFFSIFALVFLTTIGIAITVFPETRAVTVLIPLALLGVVVNAGLLFIVFKDILTRSFANPGSKMVWGLLIFSVFPRNHYLPAAARIQAEAIAFLNLILSDEMKIRSQYRLFSILAYPFLTYQAIRSNLVFF